MKNINNIKFKYNIFFILMIFQIVFLLLLLAPIENNIYGNDYGGDTYPEDLKYPVSFTRESDGLYGFIRRQCTSFVAHCLNTRNGVKFNNYYKGQHWGDAKNWGTAAKNAGFTVDNNPKVGSVAWKVDGQWGHVAWVESVNGNNVTIQQYNEWPKEYAYSRKTKTKAALKNEGYKYIHIKDIQENVGSEVKGSGKTIANGNYYIVSALDMDKLLDVKGYPNKENAKVQLYHHLHNTEQVYKINYNKNNKCYYIKDTDSGCKLVIKNANKKRGVVPQIVKECDGVAQRWNIKKVDDSGLYEIQALCNGYYLDAKDGKSDDGTEVRMWDSNHSKAQRWYLIPYFEKSEKLVNDGEYCLISELDNNYVLDVGGNPNKCGSNVKLYHRIKASTEQIFKVRYQSDGFYHFQDYDSGCLLDLADADLKKGTNVQVWDSNNCTAQDWVLEDAGDGCYYIRSRCNGYYLDVKDGVVSDTTNVRTWEGSKSNAQKWRFVPYVKKSARYVADGEYCIVSAVSDSNKTYVLDVGGDPNKSGANMQLYHHLHGTEQTFKVKYQSNGYYQFQDKDSATVLDLDNLGLKSGCNVLAWKVNNGINQDWTLEDAGGGYYYIRSACSGYYLDATGGKAADGTNVRVWTGNKSNAQKWKFMSASFKKTAVRENYTEPTYTENGSYDSVVYCNICGEEISRTKVSISKLGTTQVYRLYTDINGEHLYTTDANERDVLTSGDNLWKYEGVAWVAPAKSEKPVYRLYNPVLKNHLYTTDENEVKVLTEKHGWVKDFNGKPLFYSGGDISIFRLYNEKLSGMHLLTADENEYNILPGITNNDWLQEGVKINCISKN